MRLVGHAVRSKHSISHTARPTGSFSGVQLRRSPFAVATPRVQLRPDGHCSAVDAVLPHRQNAASGVWWPAVTSSSTTVRGPTRIRAGTTVVCFVHSRAWLHSPTP